MLLYYLHVYIEINQSINRRAVECQTRNQHEYTFQSISLVDSTVDDSFYIYVNNKDSDKRTNSLSSKDKSLIYKICIFGGIRFTLHCTNASTVAIKLLRHIKSQGHIAPCVCVWGKGAGHEEVDIFVCRSYWLKCPRL